MLISWADLYTGTKGKFPEMKITLDIPDDLIQLTKSACARLGCHLNDNIANALREKLKRDEASIQEKTTGADWDSHH